MGKGGGGPCTVGGRSYAELDNFFQCAFTLDGVRYTTSEAAFQAQKFPRDTAAFRAVGEATSGEAAWGAGQTGVVRTDWEDVKVDAMHRACLAKFEQDPGLRAVLCGTAGAIVAEGPTSPFWMEWNPVVLERVREELRPAEARDEQRRQRVRGWMAAYRSRDDPLHAPARLGRGGRVGALADAMHRARSFHAELPMSDVERALSATEEWRACAASPAAADEAAEALTRARDRAAQKRNAVNRREQDAALSGFSPQLSGRRGARRSAAVDVAEVRERVLSLLRSLAPADAAGFEKLLDSQTARLAALPPRQCVAAITSMLRPVLKKHGVEADPSAIVAAASEAADVFEAVASRAVAEARRRAGGGADGAPSL